MEINSNFCEICNSKELKTIFAIKQNEYIKCLHCGFIKKIPNVVSMNYQEDYHSKDSINRSKALAKNYFKRLGNKIDSNKDCLEIGGSFGFFSKMLQEQKICLTRNIEPSLFAASYANSQNIKTFSDINELDVKQFDYIFSFHVIEHIKADDIKMFIVEAMKLLKPNGKFYIFTPNANSFLLRLLGKYYAWLAPDQRLNFLTCSSFEYLLDSNEAIFLATEEIPAFAHYPIVSFVTFVRKKIFKYKVSDFVREDKIDILDRTRQNSTELDRTRQNSTELDRTRQNSTELDRTRQNSTELDNLILNMKKIFHIILNLEKSILYPIYRFLNLFTVHHDELVIEITKK